MLHTGGDRLHTIPKPLQFKKITRKKTTHSPSLQIKTRLRHEGHSRPFLIQGFLLQFIDGRHGLNDFYAKIVQL